MYLLWILIIAAALLLWAVADYQLGKQHFRKIYQKREYPVRKGNFHIFTNGKELFTQFFSDIQQAKSCIYVQFYIVTHDEISKELFSLLASKAKEGVEVKLLLDWAGGRKVKNKMIHQLKQAGAKISFSHRPSFPFLFFSLQQRNHRKISVIDEEIAYLGGFNVGKNYIDMNPKLSPWRDYHLRMTGESIQDLQQEFIINWNAASKMKIKNTKPFLHKADGEIRHQIVPTEGIFLETIFCSLINEAKSSIFIGTPYFIPTHKMHSELVKALDRGIELTILVPEKADHILVKEAAFRYFRILQKKGAQIYQYKPGFYHAKIIIVDQSVCDVGTANFDRRSVQLNHEVNCMIYDHAFIKHLSRFIQEDLHHAVKLTPQELNRTGLLTRLKEATASCIGGLL